MNTMDDRAIIESFKNGDDASKWHRRDDVERLEAAS